MKAMLFSFLVILNFTVFSQNLWEIKLATSMPETRMGKWVVGDYTVFVSMDTISVMLRKEQEHMIKAIAYYGDQDSNLVNYYKATATRYNMAASQLEQAQNGFDLQSLIIYQGREDSSQNTGNSRFLRVQVDHFVQRGNAIVFYQGKRIFTLCRSSEQSNQGRMESPSDMLNHGYEIRTFYDVPENSLFCEYYHLGW
jgi:hypothetical protein